MRDIDIKKVQCTCKFIPSNCSSYEMGICKERLKKEECKPKKVKGK